MTFDDLPKLEIGEVYVQLSVPGVVSVGDQLDVLVTRALTLRPADAERLAEKLLKYASIAREIGSKKDEPSESL